VSEHSDTKLKKGQWHLLLVLALPAFGIALAYTLVTTYVPVLLTQLSGPTVTGALIAMEGLLALVVPVVVGSWSDRVRTRYGGRLPFIAVGTALAVAGLVLLPVLAGSLVGVAAALALFFVAYFVYYSPYYALFPDLVPEDEHGRSQGFQGMLRSAGLLAGIAGGGALLALWKGLPFILGAVAVVVVTGLLVLGIRGRVGESDSAGSDSRGRNGFLEDWRLVRDHRAVRLWAVGNSCWEAAIGVLRTFVVLYFTRGLGLSLRGASAALGLVGIAAVIAAPIAGKLADRYGPRPVMSVAVWVFAIGLIPPLVTMNKYFIAAILPIAFAAVVLMTLPYALLMDLLPEEDSHGAGASLFGFSRGVGIIVGPLLGGVAIELTERVPALTLAQTKGYSAMFGIAMLLLLVSTPVLHRIVARAS